MDRRSFLQVAAGSIVASGTGPLTAGQGAVQSTQQFTQPRTGVGPYRRLHNADRPNILLITADMVSPDLYHPSRPFSELVQIPNIRSLMEEGTFFENAFCTVPLCAPSRASYLTGRYSYIQGNGERAPEGLQTKLRADDLIFPEYLKADGYATRHVGKAHVGTQKFLDAFGENDHPWDRWSPPVFDDDAYLSYQRSLGVKPQKYAKEIVFKQQDRRTPGNSAGGWIVQEDGKPFPFEAHYSCYQATCLVNTLRDLRQTAEAAHPFYLQLDVFDPHQPFSIPAGYEGREQTLRKAMTLPASYHATRKRNFVKGVNEPEILDIYRKYWGLYDQQSVLDYRIAYALQMEVVDRAIGIVLRELRALNLYEKTMIVFMSDHGEMNARRGMVDKGVYLYPDVLRVPLVLKPPFPSKQNIVADTVSLLDLSPTLLEVAGLLPEAQQDGMSLVPGLKGQTLPARSPLLFFGGWHVGVNFACGLESRWPDGRHFLYAYNSSSSFDELYDLDSEDAVNLIDDAAYAEVKASLIRLMGKELQRDLRWIGYWAEFRVARYEQLPKSEGDMQLFTKPA